MYQSSVRQKLVVNKEKPTPYFSKEKMMANAKKQEETVDSLLDKVLSFTGCMLNDHLEIGYRNFTVYEGADPYEYTPFAESEGSVLRLASLESPWMYQHITLLEVDEPQGSAYTVGSRGLSTGRALEGRFRRHAAVNGTPYTLIETDTCISLPYGDMAAMWNCSSELVFDELVERFFKETIPLDILRIGLNGNRQAWPTDPENNPNGEDINIGWHELAKQFNNGSQVITEPKTIGDGGDFKNIDALAQHLIDTRIPQSMRDDPRLVVMVGAGLASNERDRLNVSAVDAANTAAAQQALRSVAGRYAFVPPFMPEKRLAVTTLANLHVYMQRRSDKARAGFVDEVGCYEHSYLRNEGYALQDGFMYAAIDEESVKLI